MAKEKKPAAARAALDAVFATAHQNMADLAAHDVLGSDNLKHLLNPNSLVDTPAAQHVLNFTSQVGTYLASLLPNHLGPFPINHNFSQARGPLRVNMSGLFTQQKRRQQVTAIARLH